MINGKQREVKRGGQTGLPVAIDVAESRRWAVVAMRPGKEGAPLEKWAHGPNGPIGWRDAETLREEWPAGRTAVGVLTGPSGLVDIDLDDPEGQDNLKRLAAGRKIPETFTLRTPNGWQYLFTVPPGREFRTCAGQVAPGIDVRGRGGLFRLYDPTQPERRITRDVVPVEIPGWLADLLPAADSPASNGAVGFGDNGGRRPLADHAATCLAAEAGGQHDALRAYVLELQRCDDDDRSVVRRAMVTVRQMPVYRRSGPRSGPYTENDIWDLLVKGPERPVADATAEDRQDLAEIAELFRDRQPGARVARRGAKPFDFAALAAGTWERPKPAFGQRADGVALFYPGREHAIYGETESGKDMWLVSVVKDCLEQGQSVIWIDFEEGDGAEIGSRLLNAGLDRSLLCDMSLFQYYTPADKSEAQAAHGRAVRSPPEITILDGVTAAYGVFGWQVKENDAATQFRAELVRPLLSVGAATISTDHVTKEAANGGKTRGRYAIGGVMKLNMVNGAAYLLESKDTIVRGGEGASRILLTKDRPGSVKVHCEKDRDPRIRFAGMLVVKSSGDEPGELLVEVIPPQPETPGLADIGEEGAEIPESVMVDVSKKFEDAGEFGLSKSAVKTAWRGAHSRKVPLAIDVLVAGGYLVPARASTSGQKLRSIKPWRDENGGAGDGKFRVRRTGSE